MILITNKKLFYKIAIYIFFAFSFLFFCFPLLWVVSISFQGLESGNHASLFPQNMTISNYVTAINYSLFPTYFYNGIKIAVIQGVLSILICTPAAYGFSRFNIKNKQSLLLLLLIFQMISGMVTIIPVYRYLTMLHLTDTHLGLIIIYTSGSVAFTTWLLKGYFDGIPKELDDVAMIDGCTRFQSFLKVTAPIAIPGISAALILNIIGGWSNFMTPYILITTPSKQPLAVGIMQFSGSAHAKTPELLAAGTVLSLIPAVVIFLSLQKYIINSIGGALKG